MDIRESRINCLDRKRSQLYFTHMVNHEVCFSYVFEMNIIAVTKLPNFSKSAFIGYYTFKIDFTLDRSVKGQLVTGYWGGGRC